MGAIAPSPLLASVSLYSVIRNKYVQNCDKNMHQPQPFLHVISIFFLGRDTVPSPGRPPVGKGISLPTYVHIRRLRSYSPRAFGDRSIFAPSNTSGNAQPCSSSTSCQPGLDLKRNDWTILNRYRTGHGICAASLHVGLWVIRDDPLPVAASRRCRILSTSTDEIPWWASGTSFCK